MTLDGKTIAILIAPRGTEEPEFAQPKAAVEQAGGKVVVISLETGEAQTVNNDLDPGKTFTVDKADLKGGFGESGHAIVVEEFMEGEEASFFALTDGSAILPFGSAQDHKRVGDGDTGPNTGGMGAYSPARVLTPELEAQVIERIIKPTVETLSAEGMPYSGVLYAGLMLTEEGPKLIEYNARFGDPECQVLMMRFDGDLVELLLAVAEGRLAEQGPVALADRTALTIVMAANGYPGTSQTGSSRQWQHESALDQVMTSSRSFNYFGENLLPSYSRLLWQIYYKAFHNCQLGQLIHYHDAWPTLHKTFSFLLCYIVDQIN